MDEIDRFAAPSPTSAMLACIAACTDCCGALRGFARAGARAGPGSADDRALWRLMLDCAEICEATASFLRTESIFLPQLTESCTHLCDDCAAACEQAGPGDAGLAACVLACRRCAQACFALRGMTFVRVGQARHADA